MPSSGGWQAFFHIFAEYHLTNGKHRLGQGKVLLWALLGCDDDGPSGCGRHSGIDSKARGSGEEEGDVLTQANALGIQ
jgi:hypothetical protein